MCPAPSFTSTARKSERLRSQNRSPTTGRETSRSCDGYETQRIEQPLEAPWWDNNFTDFFTENLIPITLRDERDFEYRMVPAANAPSSDVLSRAQDLRQQAMMPLPPKRRTLLQRLGLAR